MKGLYLLYALLFGVASLQAQDYSLSGTVVNADVKPLSYVNVLVFEEEATEPIKGTTTGEDGTFVLNNLEAKKYKLTFSFVGYETVEKRIAVSSEKNMGNILLTEATETLDETIISAKKPTIEKTAGKLVFNVENTSLSVGSTFDLLKKTPGVVVIDDNIQVKFQTPEIYINNKRVYLSPSEVVSLLENTDAANIKSVEVITSPSAKYDGATGTVLNINTSKAISIGYKGSVNGSYKQGTYPKYRLGTSHFYKNNWINFYGSYGFNTRKNLKEDDNFTRFFNPDGSTNSIWNSDFKKITRTNAHQANLISDFTLDDKQTISLAATFSINPNETYDNTGFAVIRNPQKVIDSTFTTLSDRKTDTHTLSITGDYKVRLNAENSDITVSANYTDYNNERLQNVGTTYRDPAGNLLRENSFLTDADQTTTIFTGQADLTHSFWKGSLEAGVKYSNIDSNSKLDFFDTDMGGMQFNASLSDDFNYREKVFAEYINFDQAFGDFSLVVGLRGEYTDVEGQSRTLGETNTDDYFKLFPRVLGQYDFNEKHSAGFSYTKSISRPHYQNLNPFKYFINENNFNEGNPRLVPAISDKIALNYSYNGVWSFEAYYETIDNSLSALTFQDNENRTLRNSEANLLRDFQYSLDISYTPRNLPNWLYLYVVTSTFYLENEFLAVESVPRTYKNHTAGFYGYVYSNFTLSKDRSLTADLSSLYISNVIQGSSSYKNKFFLNLSVRKSFWDNAASITVGVDDIFNTALNFPVVSKYYNQDNYYTAQSETRLFTVGFKYNFGNARLRDNNRATTTKEAARIN
ncbi:outer membrane beta-barrel family protein [Marixanthomonas spongiae]|uniref:TonB-dependent receptor n=1 Tax=Marixanthomonas spongiae TaxID=2174845 RepID=A0A2U0I244_9FLAO|nr:outer membrane beta-barrel family protein [Marixanthomonas spongiae]PVW15191.1 TonB-dependent receptor [Marixanthomonas spongiae]